MNRRMFLGRASMGALGFSFFSGFPFRLAQPGFSASLESFFLSIGAQTTETDAALEAICAKESLPWRKTGYVPFDGKYYLCQKGQKAIHLLHLPHQETGSLDISALVLQEDASMESWRLVASLSGFQLEALVIAAAALKTSNSPKHLADLLLPALYKTKKTPGRFATEQGEVSVHAVLGKDKTIQVEAAVYESGYALWSSKYISQYLQSL
ncbi:MAG: hypothetical protein ACKV1O_10820 [Saprospiraceae bacterium]